MSDAIDIRDIRFQRQVHRLHRLGPRVIAELLVELGARRMLRHEIEMLVERYAAIEPSVLWAVGGDKFPPVPLREVNRL